MLKLDIHKRAQKFIDKLPPKHQKQVASKILELKATPFPQDSKKLVNMPFWRVSSGEYRIAYYLDEETLVVAAVAKRNDDEIYKQLERLI